MIQEFTHHLLQYKQCADQVVQYQGRNYQVKIIASNLYYIQLDSIQNDSSNDPKCCFDHKYIPCPEYEKGFCYLGTHCPKKHIVRKLCLDYVYGFCKDGPDCKMVHVKLFDLNDFSQELRFTEKYYQKLKTEMGYKPNEINVKPVICKSCGEVGHKSNACRRNQRLSPQRIILCGICDMEHPIIQQGKLTNCEYKK